MAKNTLQLIIRKTRRDLIKRQQNIIILLTIIFFCIASIGIAYSKYIDNISQIQSYQKEIREEWEHRPAKHPHRMAHYGYLVFRTGHPLNIFDNGLDDYLGNVIFLEAHKQNTANLSEAGSSGILVRFGSFSAAFILQSLVPLIILFLGFGQIVREREDATLKILAIQGASGRTIVWGKILGLWQFSLLFLIPIIPFVFFAAYWSGETNWQDLLIRLVAIVPAYVMYYFFICSLSVIVSSWSKSSVLALVQLIGCWLLLVIFLPKAVQFAAQNIYETPSRIAFETKLEEDILKEGDSHNPDDPHFRKIKDSLLAHYKVSSTDELPINYSGLVMKEGEKISSAIYARHQEQLQDTYQKQQDFTTTMGFLDPMIAIRNFSMTASGTDFFTYRQFQKQAEVFRFKMAQTLNDLQIENISNIKPKPGETPATISAENWKKIPDFNYEMPSFSSTFTSQPIAVVALFFWSILCIIMIELTGRNLKLI